ncbi:MAG: HNH endonuclease [Phycisphaerales bacterium]
MRAKHLGSDGELRADFDLAFEADTVRITVHARGGSESAGNQTNPDYESLVQILLERLAGCGAALLNVRLASKTVAHLPASQRRVQLPKYQLPLPLISVPQLTDLRYAIRRAVAASHTTSATAGHGNATKRIELIASRPMPAADMAAILEWGVAESPDGGDRTDADEGTGFSEGRLLLRIHLQRERNQTLVRLAKDAFVSQNGRLYCESCGFDFEAVYGNLGAGYIEAHHEEPLGARREEGVTRVEDLRMVCANCHRMLHRRMGDDPLTVEGLRCRLRS